jgi:hypothetical protein
MTNESPKGTFLPLRSEMASEDGGTLFDDRLAELNAVTEAVPAPSSASGPTPSPWARAG